MRIALVSMHTSPTAVPGSGDAGGMNVVVAEAAGALAARGHDVVVATRASAGLAAGEYPLLAPAGTPVRDALTHSGAESSSPRVVAIEAGPRDLAKHDLPGALPEFAAGLKALGPFDAVHAHYWLSGIAAQRAVASSDSRIAVTFHTLAAQKNAFLAPGDAPEGAARLAAEHELAASSVVVAGSRSELGAVEEFCGTPPHGSVIVHPGVNTRVFRPTAGELSPPPSATSAHARHRITVLGRVQPLKGQDLALEAAAVLARSDPGLFASTEWVFAGEPTPGAEGFAAGLRDTVTANGLSNQVRFLPAQSRGEAAALLASSTLVLVPSHSETFGLTALEAAACGVPVVAAGHTGLLEAVPAGVAAAHLTDRDPAAWAAAIARLLRDDAGRARIGHAARVHALAHDWAAHAAALERVYERIAGRS